MSVQSSAVDVLASIDRNNLNPEERGLVGLTWAAIHHINGDRQRLLAEVETIAEDAAEPALVRDIAVSWRLIVDAMYGGCISDAVHALRGLAAHQRDANLQYFAGVTLHNAAFAELSRGNYAEARELARQAIKSFERAEDDYGVSASTHSTEATAIAELGDLEEGLRLANASATNPDATADAIADAAYMHAVCGRLSRARSLLARYERGDSRWSRELGAQAQGWFARFAIYMSEGNLAEARVALETLQGLELQALDARSRIAVVAATLALVEGSDQAEALTKEAMTVAASQHAWRWMARARILDAVVRRDPESLATWISETEGDSALALLELADVVASAIGTLAPLPSALERSILREPTRWVAALGRQVRGKSEDAGAAASLVARFGTVDDADPAA